MHHWALLSNYTVTMLGERTFRRPSRPCRGTRWRQGWGAPSSALLRGCLPAPQRGRGRWRRYGPRGPAGGPAIPARPCSASGADQAKGHCHARRRRKFAVVAARPCTRLRRCSRRHRGRLAPTVRLVTGLPAAAQAHSRCVTPWPSPPQPPSPKGKNSPASVRAAV